MAKNASPNISAAIAASHISRDYEVHHTLYARYAIRCASCSAAARAFVLCAQNMTSLHSHALSLHSDQGDLHASLCREAALGDLLCCTLLWSLAPAKTTKMISYSVDGPRSP
jgi:hypothetical protein